jgi:hypothetical protein
MLRVAMQTYRGGPITSRDYSTSLRLFDFSDNANLNIAIKPTFIAVRCYLADVIGMYQDNVKFI